MATTMNIVLPKTAPSTTKSIAIIGAGPSGLMAAEHLAQRGYEVTIYDKMASVGRKFLLAGRGGLNLTHSEDFSHFLSRYREAEVSLAPMIEQFSPDALRAWAQGLGQELFVGSSGRVFPRAMKASPLLRAWLKRLADLGVVIKTGWHWQGWSSTGALLFDGKPSAQADATLLALGGASWAKLGSDGAWQTLFAGQGIAFEPLVASNVGVVVNWAADVGQRFAGSAIKGVAVSCAGHSQRGDLIVKTSGLEGGPLYGLGAQLRAALKAGSCEIGIDFRPDMQLEALASRLSDPAQGKSVSTRLKTRVKLPSAAIALMREGLGASLPQDPTALALLIKHTRLQVVATQAIDRAISSAGGVKFEALDGHLMVKAKPGVFVAGEMLDWDAPTGGYLLQACFATGVAAAHGVDRFLGGPAA
jgi:uncharacterized flavoprotein (TIGR03862 family)